MPRPPTHRPPTPPGEVLLHDFIEPLGLTQADVARAIHVPYQRLNEVVRGARAVTAETALRLAKLFGTSPDLWLNLQQAVDLHEAQQREGEALASRAHGLPIRGQVIEPVPRARTTNAGARRCDAPA